MSFNVIAPKIGKKILLLEIFCTSFFWGFFIFTLIVLFINSRFYWEFFRHIDNANANIEKIIYLVIWQILTNLIVMCIYKHLNLIILFASTVTAVLIFGIAFIIHSILLLIFIALIPITILLSVFLGSYGLTCSILRLLRIRVGLKTVKNYGWNAFIPLLLFMGWINCLSGLEFGGLLFIIHCIFITSISNTLFWFHKIKVRGQGVEEFRGHRSSGDSIHNCDQQKGEGS